MVLSLIAAMMAAGAVTRLAAQPGAHGTAETGSQSGNAPLRITLRVYNFPKLPRSMLASAEETATMIFRHAGVDVAWVDCPLSSAELLEYPACWRKIGFTDFAVRILNRSMVEKMSFPERTLGFGLPCADDRQGCYADVFYYRVAEVSARGWGIPPSQILGHALAHEVGHLLLGPNSHSSTGLMRATWDVPDLQAMSRMSLLFTSFEARRIRAGVSTRMRREHLLADSSVASAGAR